jgi:hypothetical protein
MHQTRKGQQGYFGMKLHIGVDSPISTLPEGACRDRCARKGLKGAQRLPKQALWGKAQYLCGPYGIQIAV